SEKGAAGREGFAVRSDGAGSPASGGAASSMDARTERRLLLRRRHVIKLSAPLVWIHCRGPVSRSQEDYTHPARAPQFEIFIAPIDFSDAEGDRGVSRSFPSVPARHGTRPGPAPS